MYIVSEIRYSRAASAYIVAAKIYCGYKIERQYYMNLKVEVLVVYFV